MSLEGLPVPLSKRLIRNEAAIARWGPVGGFPRLLGLRIDYVISLFLKLEPLPLHSFVHVIGV